MSKPNWEEIRREWEATKITFKDLADKYDMKDSTIRSRKNREKWQRNKSNNATQRKQNVATKTKRIEPVVESDNLTDKQRLFCIYYIKYFNATKAYRKAYECDYTTANVNGSRLLVNASIKSEIQRMKEEKTAGLMLDVRDVLQKYIDIAFADVTDYVEFGSYERPELNHDLEPMVDEEGNEITYSTNYVNLRNSDEIDGTILTEVKQGRDGISVKLADKMRALEMLSKYFGLLSDSDKERYQLEKLKAETARTKAETSKIKGDDGFEYEDDGFIDAIKASADIWDDEND